MRSLILMWGNARIFLFCGVPGILVAVILNRLSSLMEINVLRRATEHRISSSLTEDIVLEAY